MSRQQIEVVGVGSDEYQDPYLVLRTLADNHVSIPFTDINGKDSAVLARLGRLGILAATRQRRTELLELLQKAERQRPTLKVATNLGWCGTAFVTPYGVFGAEKDAIYPDLSRLKLDGQYRSVGSLEDWRGKVADPCGGNPLLILVLCTAFVGPLLALLGEGSFTIQVVGRSSIGKSTALVVAGSVWGCHLPPDNTLGFGQSWNTTLNGIADVAMAHNHVLLILDETRAAGDDEASRARVIIPAIMTLSAGVDKRRQNAGPPRRWSTVVLGSTNLTQVEMSAAGGTPVDDAYRVRSIDVPAEIGPYGVFSTLHGRADGDAFSKLLQRRARASFGTAGEEFLERLTADLAKDGEGLRARLRGWQDRYRRKAPAARTTADGRVQDRFALIYAAGKLAAHYGILPWGDEIGKAVRRFEAGHHHLVRATATPSVDLVAEVRAYLRVNLADMPAVPKGGLRISPEQFEQAPGFCRNGAFLVTCGRFERAFPNARAILAELEHQGLLLADKGRKVKKHTIRADHRDYAYAIAASILES